MGISPLSLSIYILSIISDPGVFSREKRERMEKHPIRGAFC
jgi:hypothetical protein